MDCDFSPSSPHLLPNGLFSPQNRISFELLALSGLSGFSTFKGGKMLIFQGFANSRIVREFPPFSFKVRIATLTRNAVSRKGPRVRIPNSPPKTQSYQGFCPYDWAFLFSQGHIGVHDFRQELRCASRSALCPAESGDCPLHLPRSSWTCNPSGRRCSPWC